MSGEVRYDFMDHEAFWAGTRWIPVAEPERPGIDEQVLVQVPEEPRIHVAVLTADGVWLRDRWLSNGGRIYERLRGVTHWRRIPPREAA